MFFESTEKNRPILMTYITFKFTVFIVRLKCGDNL